MPSGTVTFLFTDVEGSTRLWEEQPEVMRAALAVHDEILREAIEAQGGQVVKSTGDGAFAVFGNAHDGVRRRDRSATRARSGGLARGRGVCGSGWGCMSGRRPCKTATISVPT